MEDDPALLLVSQDPVVAMEDDEYEDQDDEEEEQDVKVDFIKALKEYGEKVTGLCSGDKSTLKAMKAMTKTLNNSLKSTPHMLQQQMHGFNETKSSCCCCQGPSREHASSPWQAAKGQVGGGGHHKGVGTPCIEDQKAT